MSERVLVIGGSGFLGSHTADHLSKHGYDVFIYDTKKSKWLSSSQKFIQGDFLDQNALSEIINDVSYVYHFGAMADISESKKFPLKAIEINIAGTAKILEIIRNSPVKRFMFASTAYVYSDQGSFYRVSKQSAESIIEEYSKQYDIDYTLMRYGSLYGPRSQPWNGIRKFVRQIIEDNYLDYSGNGEEIREYIHVEDAARISVNLLEPKYKNQAIMITGQQVIKSRDLFKMIFEILHKDLKINYLNDNLREDHYGNTPYRYSPKTAKKIFPLEFVDLGQGLLNLIEEVQEEINQKNDQ